MPAVTNGDYTPEYASCINLLRVLIEDSKENLLQLGRKKKLTGMDQILLRDSQDFLMDKYGKLSFWLEGVPTIPVRESIEECRKFANGGWRHERVDSRIKN
jgi:hypothetical protein